MTWTPKQIALWKQACAAIGWGDAEQHMVLSPLAPRSTCPKRNRVSAAAPRLTNGDFEHAMAVVELASNGQVKVKWPDGKHRFGLNHWQAKADDELARMRGKVFRLAQAMEAHAVDGKPLRGGGAGLRGWIRARVTQDDRRDQVDQLDHQELYNLIEGLKAYASRNGLRLGHSRAGGNPQPTRRSHVLTERD